MVCIICHSWCCKFNLSWLEKTQQELCSQKSKPAVDSSQCPRCPLQLQVLKRLHAHGHHLGAIRPERILVHPDVYMLDLAPGMITACHMLMLLWLITQLSAYSGSAGWHAELG